MESYPSLDRPERQILGDIVLNGVSLDALVAELGTSRNGIYKMLFGVRRKLRAELVANRYLDNDNTTEALVNESTVLDRFLHTGPHDVRYEKGHGVCHTSTSTWCPPTSPRPSVIGRRPVDSITERRNA
jgi:hypothetical protein